MHKVKLNKTFDFEIHNVAFGDLTKEEAIDICKDGRLASHFLERQLTKWFPELTHVTCLAQVENLIQPLPTKKLRAWFTFFATL